MSGLVFIGRHAIHDRLSIQQEQDLVDTFGFFGRTMEERHIRKIAEELLINPHQVKATAELISEGATVPFIARYRKEVTGSLDEVAVTEIRDRLTQLEELDKRREAILKSLRDQGKLTDDLKNKVEQAETMAILEDIYLPYRPKRRTRATIAKEKGLEPLAEAIFKQEGTFDPGEEALTYVNQENGVESVEVALSGARDIIAEWVNEDQEARNRMRSYFSEKAIFISKVVTGKEVEAGKYRDYFEWQEPVATAPSHRILAMRRGEKEGFLNLWVVPPDEEEACALLESLFVTSDTLVSEQVRMAVQDSYRRLLSNSMETEIRMETKKRADEEAIRVFGTNVRQLLMSPPLGQKRVMAIDPGFRTGCKLVCLDAQGKLLHYDTIYPLLSEKGKADASQKVRLFCEQYAIEAIAVGNGTGGRETEAFILSLGLDQGIQLVVVNESGASVYSASEAARDEFPDHDVTVRGAVSIGRRLMDPLAELVKIDPKSIGVGQYQHDVDQKALGLRLDDVVMSCVNAVGVEVNTASRQLLTYVSGLGPQLAKNIVNYRDDHGPFESRESLKQVPRLGTKAFEQAAGFLRILGGSHPLDRSAVHPEAYGIVESMAKDLNCSVEALFESTPLQRQIDPKKYATDTVGLPTLKDIMEELAKPGRDPRETFETFRFDENVQKPEDLQIGMKLPGIVTNITAFGVFVDIGVHQDGLVHVSNLADHFVKDPNDVVKVHDRVQVTVIDLDLERKRISLSMKTGVPEAKSGSFKSHQTAAKGKKQKQTGKPVKSPSSFNNPFAALFKKN